MDEGFYVTLPSNASLGVYENNTLTDFTTHLHDPIRLDGSWCVALAEIHYPHCWYTYEINSDDYVMVYERVGEINGYVTSTLSEKITLPTRKFTDAKHLVNSINAAVGLAFNTFPLLSYETLTQRVIFHESATRNDEGKLVRRWLRFSDNLRNLLGGDEFSHRLNKENQTHTSSRVVSLRNNFDQIYLYTDIIEPTLVGDSRSPLLRLLPIKGYTGESVSIILDKRCYQPLARKEFHSIEIQLRNDIGRPIQFITGRVVVVLHFRRGKPVF